MLPDQRVESWLNLRWKARLWGAGRLGISCRQVTSADAITDSVQPGLFAPSVEETIVRKVHEWVERARVQ